MGKRQSRRESRDSIAKSGKASPDCELLRIA
jgi:hypothetical protein